MVYLKLLSYIQDTVVAREFPKLAAKFYVPYRILGKICKSAYKWDLPDSSAIHLVLHVSLLKAVIPSNQEAAILPPSAMPITNLKPMAILDRRTVKRGNVAATECIIHCSNHYTKVGLSWRFSPFSGVFKRRYLSC